MVLNYPNSWKFDSHHNRWVLLIPSIANVSVLFLPDQLSLSLSLDFDLDLNLKPVTFSQNRSARSSHFHLSNPNPSNPRSGTLVLLILPLSTLPTNSFSSLFLSLSVLRSMVKRSKNFIVNVGNHIANILLKTLIIMLQN